MTMLKEAGSVSVSGDPHKKIAELEVRIAKLEAVLKIGSGGSVTLKATNLSIESSLSMNTKAGGSMTIQSSGPMHLKGATVDIN
jgi:hypothetical protein